MFFIRYLLFCGRNVLSFSAVPINVPLKKSSEYENIKILVLSWPRMVAGEKRSRQMEYCNVGGSTGGGSGGQQGQPDPPTLAEFNNSPIALHGKK